MHEKLKLLRAAVFTVHRELEAVEGIIEGTIDEISKFQGVPEKPASKAAQTETDFRSCVTVVEKMLSAERACFKCFKCDYKAEAKKRRKMLAECRETH